MTFLVTQCVIFVGPICQVFLDFLVFYLDNAKSGQCNIPEMDLSDFLCERVNSANCDALASLVWYEIKATFFEILHEIEEKEGSTALK